MQFLTSVNLFTLSSNFINIHHLILNFHTLNTSHFCSFEMSYTKLKYLSIYLTLCAGVVSHLLLFICWIKDPLKCFRNSATYLVTNLALADFMACTVGLIRMKFSQEFSTVFYISNTALLVSLFSILSIAIDRYLLTVHPFKHRVLLNGRRICIWIASIWLLSFCPLVKDLTLGPNETDTIIYNAMYFIIAMVSSLIYAVTYFSLKKHGRDISQQNQSRDRALREFVKTIIIVAFIQILTLVPAYIAVMVTGCSKSSSALPSLRFIVFQMYCLNFAINPFLYIWRLRNYRQTFRLLICRK